MARFGDYETAGELFHSPFATMYVARPAGSTEAGEFAVKVANPVSERSTTDRSGSESGFIARARLQQNAARNSGHWAAIHDLGSSDEGQFYVTDLYPRTAQKLISGRIDLSGAGLHHLVRGLAAGLRELREAARQAHGNLKPTNVLLSGAGEVAGAKVALADPLTDPAPESESGGDMYSIGSLIYQLVMHRSFRHASWPIADSPEWTRLGEAGDLWRALCSSLLNPELPHRTDLDGLERSLAALEPSRLALSHVLWAPVRLIGGIPFGKAAAAILLLLIGGAVAAGAYVHQQEAATRQRVRLARQMWFDSLRTGDGDVLARCAAANGAPVIDSDVMQTVDLPPTATLIADLSPKSLNRAQKADQTLDQVRGRLLTAYNQAGERLRAIQNDYLSLGLYEGFASVELAIAEPEPDDDRLLFALRKRFHFADRLAKYPRPQMDAATVRHLADMDRSGDKLLVAFAKALRDAYRTAAVPVTTGWQSTPLVDELAARVAAVKGWPGDYAEDRLNAEEHLNLQKPTLVTINQWLACVSKYAWVRPAPRALEARSSLAQELDAADSKSRGQLMRFLTADSPLAKKLESESDDIRSRIGSLSQQPFVRKDLPQAFDAQVAAIRASITALPGRYQYQPPDLADWLEQMRGRTARFIHPAARDFWRKWMGDRGVESIDGAWVRQTQAMAATVTRLDQQTLRAPASLAAEPWGTPVRDYANRQMLEALQSIAPGQTEIDAGEMARLAGQFSAWCGHVEKLKDDYTDLHDVPITANTIRLLHEHWSTPDEKVFWKTEVENNGTFSRIMQPELDRIAAARAALKAPSKAR